ncbi:unnamed protein product [Urochloa humidicola]
MPQVRIASRSVLASHSGGGFFVRRVASPGIVVAKCTIKPLARRARLRLSNKDKENVPPAGAIKAAPKSRSPLPDWYPRTPLRDITSIVKALERRSRQEDAEARQHIQQTEDSSQSVDPTPVQAEQNDHHSTQQAQETLGACASGPGSTSGVANLTTSVVEGKLKESSSPSDCSLQTVQPKPNDSVLADLMEKKLSRSIEQIEKMVGQRLKETPKAAQPSKVAVQRRTLMSMR